MTEEKSANAREKLFKYPEGFLDEDLPKGRMSPSSFNTYRRCPKQYYYAYIEELKRPPGIAMFKGTMVHYGAEVIHKNTIATSTLMPLEEANAKVSDKFEEDKKEIKDWEGFQQGIVKDTILTSLKVYYTFGVPGMRPKAAEEPFMVKIGDVPMVGVLDLIDQVPGDYEVGDDPDKPPPLVEELADMKNTGKLWPDQKLFFEPQFTIYAIARNTNRVRADFLIDQKAGVKYVPKRALRSVKEKQIITEDIMEVAELIKQGAFPRCDPTGWNCTPKFCGFCEKCRGGF